MFDYITVAEINTNTLCLLYRLVSYVHPISFWSHISSIVTLGSSRRHLKYSKDTNIFM